MRRLFLLALAATVLVAFGATAVEAGVKVTICHIPPGNPDNFHTITVSDNALPAHYAHGDLPGSCDANCDGLCSDGDACTQDHTGNCEEQGCLVSPTPVDCNDGNPCTTDSCDPANGCQTAPVVCDDQDACTVDMCNPLDGQCTATPVDCGDLGVCLDTTGECDFPCDGITCEPINDCHEAGECVLPGVCLAGAPVPDGHPCNDGDPGTINDQCTAGDCAGEPSAPALLFCECNSNGEDPNFPSISESIVFAGETCSELGSPDQECAAIFWMPVDLCSSSTCVDF